MSERVNRRLHSRLALDASIELFHSAFGQMSLRVKNIPDGGVDALENFFFVLKNRIIEEIEKDPSPMRSLWNGLTDEWQY